MAGPWSKKVDDEVWKAIPDRGILAVDLAGALAWPLSKVSHSLRRMERRGRVVKLDLEVPTADGRPVHEWHRVKPEPAAADILDELVAIIWVNPYGISAAQLAVVAGYLEGTVCEALDLLQDQCRAMPLVLEGETVEWLPIMPEDGDQ